MVILTVGIDLAKNVFAVHGVNESCSGAHHWARLFQAAGHDAERRTEQATYEPAPEPVTTATNARD